MKVHASVQSSEGQSACMIPGAFGLGFEGALEVDEV